MTASTSNSSSMPKSESQGSPKKNPRAALYTEPLVLDVAPYKAGATISMDFVTEDGISTRTTAKIIRLFTPFTYSQAMLAEFDDADSLGIPPNEKVILKTFDRRFMNRHCNVGPWDPDTESTLRTAMKSQLHTTLEDFPIFGPWIDGHLWEPWQVEYRVWQISHHYYNTELRAYRKLGECQGNTVPKLFGTIKLHLDSAADDDHDIMARPVGLVLQFIDGLPIADVKVDDHISEEALPRLKTGCMQIVQDLHRCGVLHNDIHSKNILVRHADGKPFVIDFGHSQCPEGEGVAQIFQTKNEAGEMELLLKWRDAYDIPCPVAVPVADDTERRVELLGGRRPSRGPFGFIHSYRQECGSSPNDTAISLGTEQYAYGIPSDFSFAHFANPWVSAI